MTEDDNNAVLTLVSRFLCSDPRSLSPEDVRDVSASCGVTEEYAASALLAAACGLDTALAPDARLFRRYFLPMVRKVDPALCLDDPFTRTVRLKPGREGRVALRMDAFSPMEMFVRDDFDFLPDGRVFPRLGWFDRPVPYPVLEEDGTPWMTVTPNEINTIRPIAASCAGHVLTMGLGLGYFAFHACENPAVMSVTAVERSAEVIALFRRSVLPFFPHGEKLRVVQADAFAYAAQEARAESYDVIFTDLWHDVSDGLPLYRRMKALEFPGPRWLYWIEPTLRAYL